MRLDFRRCPGGFMLNLSQASSKTGSFLAYRLRLMARTGEPVFLAGKLSVRLALRFCCPAQVFKNVVEICRRLVYNIKSVNFL